jgi:hypothetical protein
MCPATDNPARCEICAVIRFLHEYCGNASRSMRSGLRHTGANEVDRREAYQEKTIYGIEGGTTLTLTSLETL